MTPPEVIGQFNTYGKQIASLRSTFQVDDASQPEVEKRFRDIEAGQAVIATLQGRTLLEYNGEYIVPTGAEAYIIAAQIIAADNSLPASFTFSVGLKDESVKYVQRFIKQEHLLKDPQNLRAFALALGIDIAGFDLTKEASVKQLREQILVKIKPLEGDSQRLYELAVTLLAAQIYLRDPRKSNLTALGSQIKTYFDLIAAGKARLLINPDKKSLPDRLKALLKVNNAAKGQVFLYAEKGTRTIDGKPVEVFVVSRKLDIDGDYIDSAVFHALRQVVQENVPGIKAAEIESILSAINGGLVDKNFDETVAFGKFDDVTFTAYLTQLGLVRNRSVISADQFAAYLKQGSIASYTIVVRTEAEKKKLAEENFEDPSRIIVSEQPFAAQPGEKALYIVTYKQDAISEAKFLAAERFKAVLRRFGLGGWEKTYGKVSPADYYTARKMQGYLEPFFSAEARAIQSALYLDEASYTRVASPDIEYLPPSQLPDEARSQAVDSAFLSWLGLKKINVAAGLEFFRKNNYFVKIKFDNTPQRNIQEVIIYTINKDNPDAAAPKKVLTVNLKTGAVAWEPSLTPSERPKAYAGLQYLLAMLPVSFDLQKPNKSGIEMLVNSAFQIQIFSQQEAAYDKRPLLSPDEAARNAVDAKNTADQLTALIQKHNLNGLQREALLQLLSSVIVKDQKLGSFETSSRYQDESKVKDLLAVLSKFNELGAEDKKALIDEIRARIEKKSTQDTHLRRLAEKVGYERFNRVTQQFVAAIFQLNTTLEWNLGDTTAVINALPEAMALAPDHNYFKLELGVSAAQGTMEFVLDQAFADRLKKATQETMRQSDQIVDDLSVAQAVRESPLGKLLEKRNLSSAALIQIGLELTGLKGQLNDVFFGTRQATAADLPAINAFLGALYALNASSDYGRITAAADNNPAAPALVEKNIFQLQVAAAHLEKNDALIAPTAYVNEDLVLIEDGTNGAAVVNQRFFLEEIAEKAPGLILLTYSAQQSQGKATMQISRAGTLAPQNLPVSRLWEIYNMHAVNDDPYAAPKQMQLMMLGLDDSLASELKVIRDKLVTAEGPDSLGVKFFNRLLQDLSAGQTTLVPAERDYLRQSINNPKLKDHRALLTELYGEIEVRGDALSASDSKLLFEFIGAMEKGYYGQGAEVSVFLSPLEVDLPALTKNLTTLFAGKSLDEVRAYAMRLAQTLGEATAPLRTETDREKLVRTTAGLLEKLNQRVLNKEPENPYFPKGILNKLAVFTASKIVSADQLREDRPFLEDIGYTLQEYTNFSSLFHSVLSVVTQGQSPMGLGQDINVVARIKAQLEPEKAQHLFAATHEQVLLQAFYQSVDQQGNLIKGPDGKYLLVENLENGFKALGVDLPALTDPNSDYLRALLAVYNAAKEGKTAELPSQTVALEKAINDLIVAKGGSARCNAAGLISQWLSGNEAEKSAVALNIQNAIKAGGRTVARLTRYFQSEKLSREFLEKLSARLGDGDYFLRQLVEKATESVLPHPVFKNSSAPLTDFKYFLSQRLQDASFEGYASLTPGPSDTPADINLKAKLSVLFFTMSLGEELSTEGLTKRAFTNWLNQTIGRDEKAHLGRYLKFVNKTILAPASEVDYTATTLLNPLEDDDMVTTRDLTAARDNLKRYYEDMGTENILKSLKSNAVREAFEADDQIPASMIRGSRLFGLLNGDGASVPDGNTSLSAAYFVYLLEDFLAGGEQNLSIKQDASSEHYRALIADLHNVKQLLESNAPIETIKPALERAQRRFVNAVKAEQLTLNPSGFLKGNPFSPEINLFSRGNSLFDRLMTICDKNGGRMELSKSSYFNENAPLGEAARFLDKTFGNGDVGLTIELNNIIDDLFAFGFGRSKHGVGASVEVGNPDNPQASSAGQQVTSGALNSLRGLYEFFIGEPKSILTNPDNWDKKTDLYREQPSTVLPRLLTGYMGLYFSMGNIVDIAALRTITDQATQPVTTETYIKSPFMTLAASFAFVSLAPVPYLQAVKYLREGDIPEFIGALIAAHHVASYTFRSWDRTVSMLTRSDALGRRVGDFMRKYDLVRVLYDSVDKGTQSGNKAVRWTAKTAKLPVDVFRTADTLFAVGADRFVGAAMWPVKLPAQALSHAFPGHVVSFVDVNGERTIVINGQQHTLKQEIIAKLRTKHGKRGLRWIRATRDFEAPIVEKARKNFEKAGLSPAEIDSLLGTEANGHSGLLRALKTARRGFWKISRGLWWRQFTSIVHPFTDGGTFGVKSTGKVVAGPRIQPTPAPATSSPAVLEPAPAAPKPAPAAPKPAPTTPPPLPPEPTPVRAPLAASSGMAAEGGLQVATPEAPPAVLFSAAEHFERAGIRVSGLNGALDAVAASNPAAIEGLLVELSNRGITEVEFRPVRSGTNGHFTRVLTPAELAALPAQLDAVRQVSGLNGTGTRAVFTESPASGVSFSVAVEAGTAPVEIEVTPDMIGEEGPLATEELPVEIREAIEQGKAALADRATVKKMIEFLKSGPGQAHLKTEPGKRWLAQLQEISSASNGMERIKLEGGGLLVGFAVMVGVDVFLRDVLGVKDKKTLFGLSLLFAHAANLKTQDILLKVVKGTEAAEAARLLKIAEHPSAVGRFAAGAKQLLGGLAEMAVVNMIFEGILDATGTSNALLRSHWTSTGVSFLTPAALRFGHGILVKKLGEAVIKEALKKTGVGLAGRLAVGVGAANLIFDTGWSVVQSNYALHVNNLVYNKVQTLRAQSDSALEFGSGLVAETFHGIGGAGYEWAVTSDNPEITAEVINEDITKAEEERAQLQAEIAGFISQGGDISVLNREAKFGTISIKTGTKEIVVRTYNRDAMPVEKDVFEHISEAEVFAYMLEYQEKNPSAKIGTAKHIEAVIKKFPKLTIANYMAIIEKATLIRWQSSFAGLHMVEPSRFDGFESSTLNNDLRQYFTDEGILKPEQAIYFKQSWFGS